jgi:hypothetical protein
VKSRCRKHLEFPNAPNALHPALLGGSIVHDYLDPFRSIFMRRKVRSAMTSGRVD